MAIQLGSNAKRAIFVDGFVACTRRNLIPRRLLHKCYHSVFALNGSVKESLRGSRFESHGPLVFSDRKDEHERVPELDLHPPEHPRLPREAEKLQDPHRNPTPREARIYDVFIRFKELPDF